MNVLSASPTLFQKPETSMLSSAFTQPKATPFSTNAAKNCTKPISPFLKKSSSNNKFKPFPIYLREDPELLAIEKLNKKVKTDHSVVGQQNIRPIGIKAKVLSPPLESAFSSFKPLNTVEGKGLSNLEERELSVTSSGSISKSQKGCEDIIQIDDIDDNNDCIIIDNPLKASQKLATESLAMKGNLLDNLNLFNQVNPFMNNWMTDPRLFALSQSVSSLLYGSLGQLYQTNPMNSNYLASLSLYGQMPNTSYLDLLQQKIAHQNITTSIQKNCPAHKETIGNLKESSKPARVNKVNKKANKVAKTKKTQSKLDPSKGIACPSNEINAINHLENLGEDYSPEDLDFFSGVSILIPKDAEIHEGGEDAN